jgi:hypothetical protein
MPKLTLLFLTVAVPLLCAASISRADEVPTLNVNKSCRADVQQYAGTPTAPQCLADEQRARQTLTAQWASFASDSRTTCTRMVTELAGLESYVELLTCLQAAKQSGLLPKN